MSMSYTVKRFFSVMFVMLFFSFSGYSSSTTTTTTTNDATADVICNIIGYIWGIGGPLITVVIIGASLLAIFGRMPWPALFALGMFIAVFFGAKTIVGKLVPESSKGILDKCGVKTGT